VPTVRWLVLKSNFFTSVTLLKIKKEEGGGLIKGDTTKKSAEEN
jgi:hypothetical protein